MHIKHYFGLFGILLWIGLLVAGSVRTILTDDSRFGRGVYNQVVEYQLTYLWLVSEKKFEPYVVPADELIPQATAIVAPGSLLRSRYGFGAVESMVRAYLGYISTKTTIYRPRVSIGVGAGITYQINGGTEQYLPLQHFDEQD